MKSGMVILAISAAIARRRDAGAAPHPLQQARTGADGSVHRVERRIG
jgi:hypothetical protein